MAARDLSRPDTNSVPFILFMQAHAGNQAVSRWLDDPTRGSQAALRIEPIPRLRGSDAPAESRVQRDDVDEAAADRSAGRLLQAFKYLLGTDNQAVWEALNASPAQVRKIREVYDRKYNKHTGKGLIEDLRDEQSGRDLEFSLALLRRANVKTGGSQPRYEGIDRSIYYIYAEPKVQPAVPGTKITYYVSQRHATIGAQGTKRTYQWYVLNDPKTYPKYGARARFEGPSSGKWEDATWGFPGEHKVICRYQRFPESGPPEKPIYLEYPQRVVSIKKRAADALKAAPAGDAGAGLAGVEGYLKLLLTAEKQEGSGDVSPKTKKGLETYIAKLKERLASAGKNKRIPIKAVHVAKETATVTRLNAFIVDVGTGSGEKQWRLIDITNPADKRLTSTHTGSGRTDDEAVKDAIDEWKGGNRYPTGLLKIEIPDVPGVTKSHKFTTTGSTYWDSISDFFSAVGVVAGIGALVAGVATMFAPVPGSRAASALIWTSIIASSAGAGIAITQRRVEGFSNFQEDAFDVLTIASSVLGGSGMALRRGITWTRGATVVGVDALAASSGLRVKMTKGVLIGAFSADAAQGILLGAKQFEEYQKIMAIKDPEVRVNRLLKLLGNAARTAAIVSLGAASTKAELAALRAKPRLAADPSAVIDLRKVKKPDVAETITKPKKPETAKKGTTAKKGKPPSKPDLIKGFTEPETAVIRETQRILASPQYATIRAAHAGGKTTSVTIDGRLIQYQADFTYAEAMTLGKEGFVMGPRAFVSEAEMTRTLLHEIHRLRTSSVVATGAADAKTGAQTTRDAFTFAQRAWEGVFKGAR